MKIGSVLLVIGWLPGCATPALAPAVLVLPVAASAAAETAAPEPPPPHASVSAAPGTADPFAYCAKVGTVDEPDARWTGPVMPEAVITGLSRAAGADRSLAEDGYWRCMNGKLYACEVGANLPCMEKANTSRTPIEGVIEFCRANPGVTDIPGISTWKATVYDWRCDGDKAVAG